MTDLIQRSIEIILGAQAPTGAYPAAVDYPTYQDCWFRDGSYIAHAMDLHGHSDSADRFHDWVASAVTRRADVVEKAIRRRHDGTPLDHDDQLHTRYALDGEDSATDWPNFQLDGLGTWLWALREHVDRSGTAIPSEWAAAADLAARYLSTLWDVPCYDCWEELPDDIHPHTLAAIHGGLRSDQALFGRDHTDTLDAITLKLRSEATHDGSFTKSIGRTDVDTSLLALATPYETVVADDPTFLRTLRRIETELRRDGGGPHRYLTDTFYGGGEWVVLAGWLAWHHASTANQAAARELIDWITAQADSKGNLPEQVSVTLNAPERHQEWVNRWGPIAQPLLWSHATYLIAEYHLDNDV